MHFFEESDLQLDLQFWIIRYTPTKGKILKMFLYCYVHKLTYQNTTFMQYLED